MLRFGSPMHGRNCFLAVRSGKPERLHAERLLTLTGLRPSAWDAHDNLHLHIFKRLGAECQLLLCWRTALYSSLTSPLTSQCCWLCFFREELAAEAAKVQELERQLEAARASLAQARGRCGELEGAGARLEAALATSQAALKACEDRLVAAEVSTLYAIYFSPHARIYFPIAASSRMQGAQC